MNPYGFRIVGNVAGKRRLIDWQTAFSAYANCDSRAELHREAYLSAYQFSDEFRHHLEQTGSTAGYAGPCWSSWLWIDIDRDNLMDALRDARHLVTALLERFRTLDEDDLHIWFSGRKGFHVGLPTEIFRPEPSSRFNAAARQMAISLADVAEISIDTGVYDKVRPFRAPNSLHAKSGLYKRVLRYDELLHLSLEHILELAIEPAPFATFPRIDTTDQQAILDWQTAIAEGSRESEVKAQRQEAGDPTLNASTLRFIREGAETGDRHRLLFSCAANLGEFGCTPTLAYALLSESALDSGLAPKDIRRQIECGLRHNGSTVEMPNEATQDDHKSSNSASMQNSAVENDLSKSLQALWTKLDPNCQLIPESELPQIPAAVNSKPMPPELVKQYLVDTDGRTSVIDWLKNVYLKGSSK